MVKAIYNPFRGKMKVLGFASGSGNTLWEILKEQLELEKTFEGSPFEVVGVFSDNPSSKAIETAKKYNIPGLSIDIREYYKKLNKHINDIEIRKIYDSEVIKLISNLKPDVIVLAGYVWATTEAITNNYTVVNVHPADLSIIVGGKRTYAGANGIKDALDAGETYLCSTSHIATSELDGGPILMISPKVNVEASKQFAEADRNKYYLKLVNEESRKIAFRTILEISQGCFGYDSHGGICYKNKPAHSGIRINSWHENIPLYKRQTDKLVNAESIAVIGASKKGGIGYTVLKNLVNYNYKGKLYAVNRKGEDVSGVKAYSSILNIDDPIELAVITVPSDNVLEAAKQCGEKGVKVIICISAGFKEMGSKGMELEERLKGIVDKYNMRLLGPNCMGIINTNDEIKLFANILSGVPEKPGNTGFITQSGAIGAGIVDFAKQMGIGFSMIASLGNQGDINVNDLLPMMVKDKNTKVILIYIETILEPERFVRVLSKACEIKTVIIIKAGKTRFGALAAASHTGSLSGNDVIADALIKKCGAIRVETIEEAFGVASALSNMPTVKGKKVGVITNAGGPGVLISDALSKYGFEMPVLPQDICATLSEQLLSEVTIKNPIDLVATALPKHYRTVLDAMVDSNIYDALLIACVPPATINTGEVAKEIVKDFENPNIPILSCFFGPTLGKAGEEVMINIGMPCFEYPEQLVSILNKMKEDNKNDLVNNFSEVNIDKVKINRLKTKISKYSSGQYLENNECEEILSLFGIRTPKSIIVKDVSEAEGLNPNYPAVVKIIHPDILHKSDVGGVILNIMDKKDLIGATKKLMNKFDGAEGILIQEQFSSDLELILGVSSDPQLGHAIMTGLGGTNVEIFKDISFGYVSVTPTIINKMIEGLKCYPLLKGYRGKPGINIEKFKKEIEKINNLIIEFPEISEIDLNPIIYSANKDEFIALDYRMRIS